MVRILVQLGVYIATSTSFYRISLYKNERKSSAMVTTCHSISLSST